jgi:hypothetical protein
MPSGHHLSLDARENILYNTLVLDQTPEKIYELRFQNNQAKISLPYLRRICSKLRNDDEFAFNFVQETKKITGRTKVYDEYEVRCVMNNLLSFSKLFCILILESLYS